MDEKIRDEFSVHMLNDDGIAKAKKLGEAFSALLNTVEDVCGKDGREMAVVRTKLQEAAFFAKRAMAVMAENQKVRE